VIPAVKNNPWRGLETVSGVTIKLFPWYKLLVDWFMQVYWVGVYTLLIELNEKMSSVGFYYKSKKSLIPSEGLFIPRK